MSEYKFNELIDVNKASTFETKSSEWFPFIRKFVSSKSYFQNFYNPLTAFLFSTFLEDCHFFNALACSFTPEHVN